VIDSLSDLDVLERRCSEFEVIFQCADSDDIPLTNSILKGLKKRFETTGIPPVLIHTSGTGVLIDNCRGDYKSDTIYSDLDLAKIEALPDTQYHRLVELAVLNAGKEGYVKTYIVLPSIIFGIVSTEFTEMELQRQLSHPVPAMVEASLSLGKTPIVGPGVNVWPIVEIQEVADFYYRLFDAIISGKNPDSGREGYYFLENGEFTQKQLAEVVATTLYKLGELETDELLPVTDEQANSMPLISLLGKNDRARSGRAFALGWKPVKSTDDFLASVKAKTEFIIKNMRGKMAASPM